MKRKTFCFNSLQTGRTFRTQGLNLNQMNYANCFNSLQTGRTFRTLPKEAPKESPKEVSIPFKREGLSEPNWEKGLTQSWSVSIPFKREGLSELLYGGKIKCKIKFQFPSNGKDFPNLGFSYPTKMDIAMFQFPSNGKDFPNALTLIFTIVFTSFVSIPFKREGLSERKGFECGTHRSSEQFQFPSNGKDFPNMSIRINDTYSLKKFQFPSNGKDFPNR